MVRGLKLTVVVGALALVSGVVAACGGDDKVSASEYVGAVCSAFGDFQTTVAEGQTTLQQAVTGNPTDAEAVKEDLSQFVSDATSASEEAASAVDDAGVPDVENGEEVASAISDAIDELTQAMQGLGDDVDSISTDSPEAFQSGAESFSSTFQSELAGIGEGVSTVSDNEELQAAADENPECQSLQGASTGVTGTTGP